MSKPKKAVNSPMGQPISPQRQNPIYPKPTVPVALGKFLSPKLVTAAGLEVVVTYPSIKKGDVIALKFNDVDTFVPIIVVENQTSVSFWISVPHIIRALETTVDIHYTLSGQSGGQRSDIFQLTVLPFMEGDLKMAKITEASPPTPGVLDLATFTGDAEVKVAPWPMIEAGQTVWLDLEYEGQSGAIPIIAGEKVTTDEVGIGMTRSILRTDLEKAPHDNLIKLPLEVNFSDVAIIPFPTLELVVRQKGGGSGDVVEDFETYTSGDKPSPFDAKGMTITGTNLGVASFAGGRALNATIEKGKADLTFSFIGRYKRATIDVGFDIAGGGHLICTYKDGDVDERPISGTGMQHYEFSHDDISSFQVTAIYDGWQTRATIDNIKLYTKALEA